jgi:REP element-mobilizing transposase RayT
MLPIPREAPGLSRESANKEAFMPQSLTEILIHLIYSTKNREPWITDQVASGLFSCLDETLRSRSCRSLAANGTADHVHILFYLGRTITVADLVRDLKVDSSVWIKTQHPSFAGFHWQAGYGAFSVGRSMLEATRQYIANQQEHHRSRSFQDEYRAFLRKYEIPFDERYVWD